MAPAKRVLLGCLVTILAATHMLQVDGMPLEIYPDSDFKENDDKVYLKKLADNLNLFGIGRNFTTHVPSNPNFPWSEEGCKLLADEMATENADLEVTNTKGDTLLNTAAAFPSYYHVEKAAEEMIKRISPKIRKIYIDRPNIDGFSPFVKSLFHMNDQFAAMLISYGAEFDFNVPFGDPDDQPTIKSNQESARMKYSTENVKSNEVIDMIITEIEKAEKDQSDPTLPVAQAQPEQDLYVSTLMFAVSNKMYETVKAMIRHHVKVSPAEMQYFKVKCRDAASNHDNILARLLYTLKICRQVEHYVLNEYQQLSYSELLPMPIYAYQTKRFDLFIGLVRDGARVTSAYRDRQYRKKPMLFDAIQEDDAKLVDAVLLFISDRNVKDFCSWFPMICGPLAYSILYGKYQAANVLLQKAYNSELAGIENLTELHRWAVCGKKDDDISEMIEDKNLTDEFGNTALHYALIFGNEAAGNHLISQGADIEAANDMGMRPIHIACKQGVASVVSLLIEKKADVNVAISSYRETPLHYASINGHLEIVKLLIQEGAYVNQQRSVCVHAHDDAIENGHLLILLELLKAGAEMNCQPFNAQTALHRAAMNGHVEILEVLIDRGANVEVHGHPHKSPLFLAVEHGRIEAVQMLVSRGANVDAKDEYGRTALHDAAVHNNLAMVEVLVRNTANVNTVAICNETPLMAAIRSKSVRIDMTLLQSGGDYEVRNANQQTALHLAAQENMIVVVKEIIRRARKTGDWHEFVFLKDARGRTALEMLPGKKWWDNLLQGLIGWISDESSIQNI